MDKVVVITGASGGIGRATALMAAQAGYAVVAAYRSNEAAARELAADIADCGGEALTVRCDVSNDSEVTQLFRLAVERFGQVDLLVSNAGSIGWEAPVRDIDAVALAGFLATNVAGAFLCAREAIRVMSTRSGGAGGVIVNVSSLAARTGGRPQRVHYAASKGAINSFTIGLAREVAPDGIRVNAVLPGLIDTSMHDRFGGHTHVAAAAAHIPLGRAGTPEEVAAAILWLGSPAASFATGALLEVGGGA